MANTFHGIPLLADWHAGYGLSQSGGLVSSWVDRTSHSWLLVQNNASAQLQYSTAQGRPSVHNNGASGKSLTRAGGLGLTGNPAITTVGVFYRLDALGTNRFCGYEGASGQVVAYGFDFAYRHGNGSRVFATPISSSWEVGVWARAAGDNYGQQEFWLNGVKQAETAVVNGTNTPNLQNTAFSVGYVNFNGYISRILSFNAKLTDTQIVNVSAQLASNWAYEDAAKIPLSFLRTQIG